MSDIQDRSLRVNRRFGRKCRLSSQTLKNKSSKIKLASSLPCISTMQMEAICSYETPVDFQWTTRR
jgi:hypothetical protein